MGTETTQAGREAVAVSSHSRGPQRALCRGQAQTWGTGETVSDHPSAAPAWLKAR